MTETIESNVNISTYLQSYLAAQNEHATQLMLKFTPEENTFESSFRNITENMFFKLAFKYNKNRVCTSSRRDFLTEVSFRNISFCPFLFLPTPHLSSTQNKIKNNLPSK